MYAISTVWNSRRARSGLEIIDEIDKLGFDNIELNSSLPVSQYLQIKELCEAGKINVVSLHNFCPLPLAEPKRGITPDMFLLSSPEEEERRLAVRFTKQTIDTAKEIGAKAVIVHLGRVDVAYDGSRTLIGMLERGAVGTGLYDFLKKIFVEKRLRNRDKFFKQALKSLDELNDFAMKSNIKLGIETRYYIREIPNYEEVGIILDRYKDGNVFYWHDVGHAQLKENLQIESHMDYLKNYGDRMLGIHIHDIAKSDDHRAPLKGNFNYRKLKPYLNRDVLKIFEIHRPAKDTDIKKALEYFKKNICEE